MKKIIILFFLSVVLSSVIVAKDVNAWKSEKTLDQQYLVFKENLNFWNNQYFMEEIQLNEFYNALTDSIALRDKEILTNEKEILSLQNQLDTATNQIEETQAKLDESIKHQNSIKLLGMYVNKNSYSFFMYMLILGLGVLSGIVYLLFKRSNKVTKDTKNEYSELKDEFEAYKKSSMERYTKINTELHNTRMKLKKL